MLEVSGAPAIVDSSKDSTYALLLSTIEGLEVEIVHLVRDSRAVAFSWQRRRRRPEIVDREEYMPVIRPAGAAAGWSARNVSAEALRSFSSRYVRLRYEDLTADPDSALVGGARRPRGRDRGERIRRSPRRPSPHGLGQPDAAGRRTARGQARRRVDVGDERPRPHRGHGALLAAPAPLRLSPLPRPHAQSPRPDELLPIPVAPAASAPSARGCDGGWPTYAAPCRSPPWHEPPRSSSRSRWRRASPATWSRSSSRAAAGRWISGCTPSPSAGPSCWSSRRRSA